jgi:SAM-dependent methyltransferase
MKKILRGLKLLSLVPKAFYYKHRALRHGLIGREFDDFGRKLSMFFLVKFKFDKFFKLLLNPVSIVRYFEFDFALKSTDWSLCKNVLDISSPRLFSLYIKKYYPEINYKMVNPDKRDLRITEEYFKTTGLNKKIEFFPCDASNLPFPNDFFDVIISISVIEHIPKDKDIRSIKEIWRCLKPSGRLILTFPTARIYREEYRNHRPYNLNQAKRKRRGFFFARIYDHNAIKKRILDPIEIKEPERIETFMTKEDFYKKYIKRWREKGIRETIKDPWYIATKFKKINQLNHLEFGVIGLLLSKKS